MSGLTELSTQPPRPGLQNPIRGYEDVWLRLEDGRLVRDPAIADSNQAPVHALSHFAAQLGQHDRARPPSEADS